MKLFAKLAVIGEHCLYVFLTTFSTYAVGALTGHVSVTTLTLAVTAGASAGLSAVLHYLRGVLGSWPAGKRFRGPGETPQP